MWLTVLGTAATALGAAVLVANTSLMLPQQSPYDLSKLAVAKLKRLDGSGEVLKGGDLWAKTGAVVMVVRRPG